jgi:hypothetical protein
VTPFSVGISTAFVPIISMLFDKVDHPGSSVWVLLLVEALYSSITIIVFSLYMALVVIVTLVLVLPIAASSSLLPKVGRQLSIITQDEETAAITTDDIRIVDFLNLGENLIILLWDTGIFMNLLALVYKSGSDSDIWMIKIRTRWPYSTIKPISHLL